jgi:MFS family permease
VSLRQRFPALRHRDFAAVLAGQLVSLTGTQMQQVAVVWQLYLFTRSPWALGLLGAFRVAPLLVFALGAGVVADAVDRRRLMMVTQSGLALVSAGLALASGLHLAGAWTLYLAAALTGAAGAFDGPARQALLPLLVPREDLPTALGLSAFVWQAAAIVGPALGGLVLAVAGVVPIYVLDAVSFVAVLVALATLRHREAKRATTPVGWDAVLDGVRFLRSAPVIRSTMLLDFVATFFGFSMLLMPIYADQILRVGPQGLGLLYAAHPAGAALAGLVLSSAGVPRQQGRAVLISVAFYGAAIAVFGVSPWFPLSLAALAASGAADTVSMVIRQTLRQLLTPDALRGRMTSINMIFFVGGPQLGEVEAGAVARAFGARISVVSGGLLCVVAVALTAVLSPALRRYRG